MDQENNEISEKEQYIQALRSIYVVLDNLKYELSAREYTLVDDEMSSIFYARDLAWITLDTFKMNI